MPRRLVALLPFRFPAGRGLCRVSCWGVGFGKGIREQIAEGFLGSSVRLPTCLPCGDALTAESGSPRGADLRHPPVCIANSRGER